MASTSWAASIAASTPSTLMVSNVFTITATACLCNGEAHRACVGNDDDSCRPSREGSDYEVTSGGGTLIVSTVNQRLVFVRG